MQMREKVGKSRNTVFFQSFVPEGFIGVYCGAKNFWLQVLCAYGTYPSLYIRQNENYKDLKANLSISWESSVW